MTGQPKLSNDQSEAESVSPSWHKARWAILACAATALSILVGVVMSTDNTQVADSGAAMPVDSDGSDVDQPPGSPNSEEADEVEGPIGADGDGGAEASEPGAQDTPTAQEISPTGQTADRIVRGYDVAVPITFDVFGVTDRSVWNVKVSRARDITAEVLAANDFNNAPPQGLIYAGYDVEITLAQLASSRSLPV